MEGFVDHYIVLGLLSGEEALKLSEKEIAKAYKLRALVLHPDKRPDDPDAHEKFQRLKTSYEVLKDEKARKLFDDLLRVQREKQMKKSQFDSKRRKMMSDLEEQERSAFSTDPVAKAYDEEERIARKRESQGRERMLKVSWGKNGEGYSAGRLREVFAEFGDVEDVVIRSTKKKCSALILMATKDGAVAATRTLCGDLSNPLLVLPLQRAAQTDFVTAKKAAEAEPQSNIIGAGYQAYEDAVMQRLRKELLVCFLLILNRRLRTKRDYRD